MNGAGWLLAFNANPKLCKFFDTGKDGRDFFDLRTVRHRAFERIEPSRRPAVTFIVTSYLFYDSAFNPFMATGAVPGIIACGHVVCL